MVYNLLSVDPEIKMPKSITEGEDGKCSFWIESSNATKIIALSKVLKNEIQMGNITVTISFRCTNDVEVGENAVVTGNDYTDAFTGNPLFSKVVTEIFPGGAKVYYAVFKREIITFFNDNMTDYHANSHFIVADIVKEIANEDSAVNVCTEYE
jgi:hypothetical protein